LWEGTVGKAADQHKAGRDAGQLPGGRYHFSSSPTFAEGVAVFNDHAGSLLGLDANTGKELWRTPGTAGSCTSPTRWPWQGRTYIVAHGKCLDPKTGKLLWKVDGGGDGASGSFAVSGGYMVTAGFFSEKSGATNGVSCYQITEKGGAKLWSLSAEYKTGHSSPLIYRNYAYFQTGKELVCVELKTGKIINKEPVTNSNPCQAPIACDDRIIMMARAGVFLFSDGSTGMKPLGAPLAPPRESTITPYAADGRLFFRGPNCLYAYELRKEM
jgi:outer membrane protein assembly factor BamB